MPNTLVRDIQTPNKQDVQTAEKELIEKLAESAKYTNEQCLDYETFSKQVRKKLNEEL